MFSFNFNNSNRSTNFIDPRTIAVPMDMEKTCTTCKKYYKVTNNTFYTYSKCSPCRQSRKVHFSMNNNTYFNHGQSFNNCNGICITCKTQPVNKAISLMCSNCKLRFQT